MYAFIIYIDMYYAWCINPSDGEWCGEEAIGGDSGFMLGEEVEFGGRLGELDRDWSGFELVPEVCADSGFCSLSLESCSRNTWKPVEVPTMR